MINSRFGIPKKRIYLVLSVILYKLILDFSYIEIISTRFEYADFQLNYSLNNYVISWVFLLYSLIFVKFKINKVSDFFFITMLINLLVPLFVLYGLDNRYSIFPVTITTLGVSLTYQFSKLNIFHKLKTLRINNGKYITVAISSICVLFLVFWYNYVNVRLNFNFFDVYEFRHENKELAGGGLLTYIISWTYQVFNILLLILSIHYRKYTYILIILIIQIFFFAASAHKSILFYPLLILFLKYYTDRFNYNHNLVLIYSLILIFPLASYFIYSDIFSSSFILRRVFLIPAKLTYVYFDFFKDNPHVYWSNSFLSFFSEYPYSEPYKTLIGQFYGFEDASANNGYISSGYAQGGVFGVFIYVFILGLILNLIDILVKNSLPLWIALSLTIIPFRSIQLSSDLLIVILTHGFIVVILMLFLLRKNLNMKKI